MGSLNQLKLNYGEYGEYGEYATETVKNSTSVQHLTQKVHFTCAEYNALTLIHVG